MSWYFVGVGRIRDSVNSDVILFADFCLNLFQRYIDDNYIDVKV